MKNILFIISLFILAACSETLQRLERVGKPPEMSKIEDPTQTSGYKPMTWPLPIEAEPEEQYANSHWQPGARSFFRDQRAKRVGDILRVNIQISDSAKFENDTERTRTNVDNLTAPSVLGLEEKIGAVPLVKPNPAALLNIRGNSSNQGEGTTERTEEITTQIAAIVTQVLPNGNMVISGKQEIRVNFEVREIAVSGVVRPEDISSNNEIDSTQIAEARIVYGGRGQITDVQQPRWGSQIVDIISPF